jgi:hypothetical protein
MVGSELAVLSALGAILLLGADGPGRSLQDSEAVEQTLRFSESAAARTIRVDDVFGSIDVVGAAVQDVHVTGEKIVRADTIEGMERARREVRLDFTEASNVVDLTVNGPFRRSDGSINWDWNERGYVVRYDLELRVPENADLVLRTVNEGDVAVHGVTGRLRVNNVNGKITLERVAGSVDASTVNGAIHASFRQDPTAPCRFHTVNGDVHLTFDSALAADFVVKTFNGEVRTDYDVVSLPPKPAEARRENGRYVYKANRAQSVRIGKGGPEISMETLNGDIVIANGN